MQLRRLTRFSRIELEKEKERARAARSPRSTRSSTTSKLLRRSSPTSWPSREGARHPAPDRAAASRPASPRRPRCSLEVTDDPCFVFLSSAGLLARSQSDEPPGRGGGRTEHDVDRLRRARHRPRPGRRASPTAGRVVRLDVLDLPALPPTANAPHLQGGAPLEHVPRARGRRTRAGADHPDRPRPRPRARHPAGRRQAGQPRAAHPRRVGGDRGSPTATRSSGPSSSPPARRSSASSPATPSCCTSAPARCGRRAAAAAASPGSGSRAGARVGRSSAPSPSTTRPWSSPSPASSRRSRAPSPASVKVTPFAEYPAKGRATGGVRCHRFLKGEDTLVARLGRARPGEGRRRVGAPVDLPPADGRRDGSGTPASQPVVGVARRSVTGWCHDDVRTRARGRRGLVPALALPLSLRAAHHRVQRRLRRGDRGRPGGAAGRGQDERSTRPAA